MTARTTSHASPPARASIPSRLPAPGVARQGNNSLWSESASLVACVVENRVTAHG